MAVGTSWLFWAGCSCGMPLRPRVVLARARLVSCPFRTGRTAADRRSTVLGGGASRSLLAGDPKRRRESTSRLALSPQRTYARVARGDGLAPAPDSVNGDGRGGWDGPIMGASNRLSTATDGVSAQWRGHPWQRLGWRANLRHPTASNAHTAKRRRVPRNVALWLHKSH